MNLAIVEFDRLFFSLYTKEIEAGIKNVEAVSPDFMPRVIREV